MNRQGTFVKVLVRFSFCQYALALPRPFGLVFESANHISEIQVIEVGVVRQKPKGDSKPMLGCRCNQSRKNGLENETSGAKAGMP